MGKAKWRVTSMWKCSKRQRAIQPTVARFRNRPDAGEASVAGTPAIESNATTRPRCKGVSCGNSVGSFLFLLEETSFTCVQRELPP